MKLIIQIPCYNEAKTLRIALDDLPRHIDGIDEIEYLIINDGSSDETENVALEWGVHYVVHFKRNLGLAKGFLAGLDLALRHGADIIVNTDADNQYCGADIEKLVRPILNREADIVIGERPIDEISHFSWTKKKLQHFGSWVVRKASKTDIPDAPSGFRAYSKKAAMRMNVHNEYTYTLETIVQAGRNKMAITSVPVRTNPELRESRLFHSMWSYIKKSILTIFRAFLMYRPLLVFTCIAAFFGLAGLALGIRYLYFMVQGQGSGHVQSVILAMLMIIIAVQSAMMGMQADVLSANRKLSEDIQFRVKKLELALLNPDGTRRTGESGHIGHSEDLDDTRQPDSPGSGTQTKFPANGRRTRTSAGKKQATSPGRHKQSALPENSGQAENSASGRLTESPGSHAADSQQAEIEALKAEIERLKALLP